MSDVEFRRADSSAAGERKYVERRRLTVMFVDLVGSAAMSTRLDPEDTEEILGEYYATCTTVFEGFGGSLARRLGDGLLVFFGHPVAHEDDAARAALAGLDVVAAVRELSERIEKAYGVTLAVRIGIHTGTVVLSDVDGRSEVDVFGAVPNLAARVQGEAAEDTVVVSDDTQALLDKRFELEALPPRELKGFGADIGLFQVVRAVRAEATMRVLDDLVPLVGREHERVVIDETVDRVESGGSEVLVIRGEAGIGKTKLATYVRDRCEARDGTVITLYCSPFHEHSVFSPIRRLVEEAAGIGTGESEAIRRERIAGVVGEGNDERRAVVETLLGLAPVGDSLLTPESLRELTFTVLVEWVASLADGPLLLVLLEDLQWADPSSLELMSRLVALQLPRTLVVITSRPEGALPEPMSAPTLTLEPLAADEVERLVAVLDADLSPESRTAIARRSSGVPLFAEELVRLFERTGEEQARAAAVPPSLQDLFQSRLDLYPAERPLVDLLAALAEPAPLPLLVDLTDTPEAELRPHLDALVGARILRSADDGRVPRYSFDHVLLADAAYDQQLRRRRRDLHRSIAQRLEIRYRQYGERAPDVLAHHFEAGGCPAEAADYWLEAGLGSAALAAYREAYEHYRRGLAIKTAFPDAVSAETELDFQIASGITLLALEGYTSDGAGDAYRRARELCGVVDDPHRRYRNLLGLWIYHSVRGNHPLGAELCDELVGAAEVAADTNLVLSAVGTKGFQDAFQGRFPEALGRLSETADRWVPGTVAPEMPQDPGVASWACRAAVHWIMGQPVEARAAAERAALEAEALGPPAGPFTRAFVYGYLVWYGELARDLEYATAAVQRSLEVAMEHGFVSWIGSAYNHLGMVQCLGDDPGSGIEPLQGSLAMWEGAGASLYVPYYRGGLAEALVATGRPDDALREIDAALAMIAAADERFYEAELYRVRGDALFASDAHDPAPARDAYATALAVARSQQAVGFEVRALMALYGLERSIGADCVALEAELRDALRPYLSRPEEQIVREALALLDGTP